MRNLTTVKADELRKAALEAMEAQDSGWNHFWRLPPAVAEALDGSMTDKASLGAVRDWDVTPAMDRWSGRVRRMLNALADEGLIVRVRRGEQTPWGHEASDAVYFTLEAYDLAKGEADLKRAAEAVEAMTWHQVKERLAAGPGVELAPSGTLSLDDWLQLLEKGGW